MFGEHARELITPEVGIWLARMLLNTNSSVYDWPELSAAFQRAGIDADGRSLNGSSRATATGGRGSSSKGTGGAGGAAPAGAGVTEERGQQGSKQQREEDWPAIARGWVRQLLKQFEVVIVPIEALDSRRLVESGQLCVRKSASNVDLNRCVLCVCGGEEGRRVKTVDASSWEVGKPGWQLQMPCRHSTPHMLCWGMFSGRLKSCI